MWWRTSTIILRPSGWKGKLWLFTAKGLRCLSVLLPGTLKYSWYKYCKALRLIKALVFINEVTEGSIDQAFCFMSWRFSSPPLLSLSHIPILCTFLSHTHTLNDCLSLIHTLSGSQTSFYSEDVLASLQVACLLGDLVIFLNLFMFLSLLRQKYWPGFDCSPISRPV